MNQPKLPEEVCVSPTDPQAPPEDGCPPPVSWWVRFRGLVPVGMTVLALVLISTFVDFQPVSRTIASADAGYLVPIALIFSVMVIVSVPRSLLVLRQLGVAHVRAGFLLRLNFFTAIVGYMVPVSVMADGVRALVFWAETKVPPAISVETSLQDRLIGLIGYVGLAVILTPFQVPLDPIGIDLKFYQLLLFVGLVIAMVVWVVFFQLLVRGSPPAWEARIHRLTWRFLGNLVRPRYLAGHALIMIVSLLLFAAIFWIALIAVGVDGVCFWALLTIAPALAIAQNIPFFYLGWGSREAAAIALLTVFVGVEPSAAVAASLMVGAGVFIGALPGLIFVGRFARVRKPAA